MLQSLLLLSPQCSSLFTASMALLPSETVFSWTTDAVASRALESFFTCPQVTKAMKRKLVSALEGHFGAMAKDKYGCHVIDKIWLSADIKLKVRLAMFVSFVDIW